MVRYILKRFLYAIFVLIGASLICCFLIRLAPGDPARMLLGDMATEEQVEAMRVQMGLDKNIFVQYFIWIGNILKGDFGTSIFYKTSCLELISQRLPATGVLTLGALVVSLSISLPLGTTAGIHKGSIIDFICVVFALIGQSMSQVWLGLLLILLFCVRLKWLPTEGNTSDLAHMILPFITCGIGLTATVSRQLRAGMFDTLQEDYVTATLAKGISRRKVYTKYAWKNALLPVVTVVGIQVGFMLCGSVVIENIFGWPGMGSLLIKAVTLRDYPLVQAILFISSFIFTLVNMIVDIVYTIVDPRMRLE